MNRLNPADELQLATLLCKKLALDLDSSDKSSVGIIGQLLLDISIEGVLFAVLTHIGRGIIVANELDADINFREMFSRANDVLPAIEEQEIEPKIPFNMSEDERAYMVNYMSRNKR